MNNECECKQQTANCKLQTAKIQVKTQNRKSEILFGNFGQDVSVSERERDVEDTEGDQVRVYYLVHTPSPSAQTDRNRKIRLLRG